MSKSSMECLACSAQFAHHQLDAGVCPECGGECESQDEIYAGEDHSAQQERLPGFYWAKDALTDDEWAPAYYDGTQWSLNGHDTSYGSVDKVGGVITK